MPSQHKALEPRIQAFLDRHEAAAQCVATIISTKMTRAEVTTMLSNPATMKAHTQFFALNPTTVGFDSRDMNNLIDHGVEVSRTPEAQERRAELFQKAIACLIDMRSF